MTGVGHGKVILLGEHSVVYGRPALAAGLSRGVTATAEAAPAWRLAVPAWDAELGPEDDHELAQAFRVAVDEEAPLRITAEVRIPSSAGLGCSAALGVAVLRAVAEARGEALSEDVLHERSLRWEGVFHGQASGVDNAVAAAGGVRLFRRGAPLEGIRLRRPLHLVVGHSGRSGSTKATVAEVRRQHDKDPVRLEKTFDAIASLVTNGRLALEDGDLAAFGQLMNLNQALLSSMLVSTPELEELCAAAREAGALGAKLTGGGGGGCMIALAPSSVAASRVTSALEGLQRDAFHTEVRGA